MNSSVVIFDLDDTLICTKIRHYKVMQDYLQGRNVNFFSYERYLELRKENGLSNIQLIRNYFPDTEIGFSKFWKEFIESNDYLKYDYPIVNNQLLYDVKTTFLSSFVLLSLRSNIESAKAQFLSFPFSGYFDECFFVAHSAVNPKTALLQKLKGKFDKQLFISDTQDDVEAAKESGVECCSVSTGFYPLKEVSSFKNINHFLLKLLYEHRER